MLHLTAYHFVQPVLALGTCVNYVDTKQCSVLDMHKSHTLHKIISDHI